MTDSKPDCTCGHSWATHAIDTVKKACSRVLCKCLAYKPKGGPS